MSEKEPANPPEPISIDRARRRRSGSKRGSERWDMEAVAHHLKTQPSPLHDDALGDGSRFLIGMAEPPVTSLELYEGRSVARIFCRNLVIQLNATAPPVLAKSDVPAEEESVVLVNRGEANDLRVGLTAEGEVSLFIAPHQALELPATDELMLTRPKQERVTITGRLGAPPSFRNTAAGALIARFPVAEQRDEVTLWHQVLVFGSRAERLRAVSLSKGQSVQVIGYLHERKSKTDEAKMIQEIYAAIVTPDRSDR